MALSGNLRLASKTYALAAYHVVKSVKINPQSVDQVAIIEVWSYYSSTEWNSGAPLYPEPIYITNEAVPNDATNVFAAYTMAALGLTDTSKTMDYNLIQAAESFLINTPTIFNGFAQVA